MASRCPREGCRGRIIHGDDGLVCLACGRPAQALALQSAKQLQVDETSAGEAVSRQLDTAGEHLIQVLPGLIDGLPEGEVAAVYRSLERLGKRTWQARCFLALALYERFSGTAGQRDRRLGEVLGLSRVYAGELRAIAIAMQRCPDLLQAPLGPAHARVAARTKDPCAWLERALRDRLTVQQLRRLVVEEDAGRKLAPEGVGRPVATASKPEAKKPPAFGVCKHCGAHDWFQVLPQPRRSGIHKGGEKRACLGCGYGFVPQSPQALYCSQLCRYEINRRKARGRRVERELAPETPRQPSEETAEELVLPAPGDALRVAGAVGLRVR